MSAGKAAAQAVHASMMLENKHRKNFLEHYRRSVIVLEAKDREQLDGIADYLTDADIDYHYYIDEGSNEVAPFSLTAMVIEPFRSEFDEKRREILKGLPLYGKTDDYDTCEDECNYVEDQTQSQIMQLRREVSQSLGQLASLKATLDRPKWYQRIFKRKRESFVS